MPSAHAKWQPHERAWGDSRQYLDLEALPSCVRLCTQLRAAGAPPPRRNGTADAEGDVHRRWGVRRASAGEQGGCRRSNAEMFQLAVEMVAQEPRLFGSQTFQTNNQQKPLDQTTRKHVPRGLIERFCLFPIME